MTGSIVVTPLQPPFTDTIMRFTFEREDKSLAVSKEDGHKILQLFSSGPEGRAVVLEAVDDDKIRISIGQ